MSVLLGILMVLILSAPCFAQPQDIDGFPIQVQSGITDSPSHLPKKSPPSRAIRCGSIPLKKRGGLFRLPLFIFPISHFRFSSGVIQHGLASDGEANRKG
jgi:hypothetical protein